MITLKRDKDLFKTFKEIFFIFYRSSTSDKRSFIYSVGACLIRSLFFSILPVIFGIFLNNLEESIPLKRVTFILCFWTIVYVCLNVLQFWIEQLWNAVRSYAFKRYRHLFAVEKIKLVFEMPDLALGPENRQKIISIIPKYCDVGGELIFKFITTLSPFSKFLFSSIILTSIYPIMIVFVILDCFIKMTLTTWINKHLKEGNNQIVQMDLDLTTDQNDTLENTSNIQALNMQQSIYDALKEKRNAFHEQHRRFYRKSVFFDLLPNLVDIFIQLFFAFWIIQVSIDRQDVGQYVMISGLIVNVLFGLSATIWNFKDVELLAFDYVKYSKEFEFDKNLKPKHGKKRILGHGNIVLCNVKFTYPEEVVPVLDNMNLTIKSGSCVAIIGNSGMGKSTLIKVMQHAYQAQSGTVEIDNCDLDTVSEASLRNCLTYINQTPIFWQQKTIKENLLMFNPKATEKDLKKALDLANLSVELSKKKKGINSKVSSLSAGQKQRLSLARAFLRKTPIVIMDEPTANLDTVAQNKVLEAIKSFQTNYHPKITLVFASNVPAEIAMADRILLMENGKIVEDGSTFDLMNDTTSKTYQRLKKYKALFEKEVNDSLSLRSETK